MLSSRQEDCAPFRDRTDAAQQLLGLLREYEGKHPLILAIPRGAVPMARIIARELKGDLDVILVRKIGAPENSEFAIGAVTEAGEVILSEHGKRMPLPSGYIDSIAKREVQKLKARRKLYARYAPVVPCHDRTVILVDDGIATGQTILAAVTALQEECAGQIIVASPVASTSAYDMLARVADRMAVLRVEPELRSVGEFYSDFSQVTEEEVIKALVEQQKAQGAGGEELVW